MIYKFTTNVVVEASSPEDALNKISGRIGAITRHLGDGTALEACAPFFTLSEAPRSEPIDIMADPIVSARREAEAKAAAKKED